ncbi:hypothetical protein ACOMHN_047826 [Nucella lapillus]
MMEMLARPGRNEGLPGEHLAWLDDDRRSNKPGMFSREKGQAGQSSLPPASLCESNCRSSWPAFEPNAQVLKRPCTSARLLEFMSCRDGCGLFPEVLSSTCAQECTVRTQMKINITGQAAAQDEMKNCNQGCVFALDEYTAVIRATLSPLPRPTLIRESKNYSSVVLEWKEAVGDNLTLHVHKKVTETNSDWQLHRDFRYYPGLGTVHVKQLHPYVTYQFKVLVVVTPLPRHVFESPPTVPITTLPHGVPTTAPIIVRLSAPSPTVVSLSWRPPTFPNGPLLGYRINLDPVGHDQLSVTTLEVPGNVTSWTFSQCQSSQLYRFSLSAWNAVGEGPSDTGNITTPNPGNLSASETPYLLLGSENKVIKANILDLTKVSKTMYAARKGVQVRGVGVHIRRKLLLLSTSEGRVVTLPMPTEDSGDHDNRSRDNNNNLYPSLLEPTVMTVDWLADRVYIASLNRLYSCPLDRDLCFVAVGNLGSTPSDVKVDPVNGYLYYVLTGQDKGLYRLDLHTIRPASNPKPRQIVSINDLSAFVVDFDNVQLYFPNNTQDTIMSCFLDGSDVKDFRPKVMSRAYQDIVSMTYANQVFFWTDGQTTWGEEYDQGFSLYRHNNLLLFEPPFSGFQLYHPKAQPTPVPLTAPTDVEALFTPNRAQIRWKPPQRLQYQGQGSWSKWLYEMELKDVRSDGRSGLHIETAETDRLNHTVSGLRPNTTYHIRVRAKSKAGVGPWSTFFIGATLQEEAIPVRVLMGIPGRIIEKDLSRLTQTTVVSFFSEPVDISWHDNLLLWTTNHGNLYVYNRHNSSKSVLQNAKNAYCVAYDWLGDKIFWSEPKLGVIRRSDPRGIHPEFIYQSEARDLAVDSLAGRLYWATTNSIDSAYLNGENHLEIFSVPFFSGRQVISLTLNFDLGKVMWYVKGYDSQELWMANLIGQKGQGALEIVKTVRPAASFHSISQTSGLQYYSHRLFWVDGVNALVVGDMQCNYTSVVAPYYNNVTSFAVAHPSMQHFPSDVEEEKVLVIPQKINKSNIHTVGDWSNFNLTWDTDPHVNHGTIFYKLFLQIGKEQIHKTTSQPWFNIRGRSPYTQLVVSLQPYTYWGYADATTLSIRSPMSTPQEPLTPRVYVTQHKNASTSYHALAADFRWSTPHVTNGVLNRHRITYWRSGHGGPEETVQVTGGTARHFILTPLVAAQTYFFHVVACTEVGCGPPSTTVSAVTDAVNPVPMLLIATSGRVSVSEFDSNLNSTTMLSQVSPSALAYLAQDNRTFWIERNDALFVSQNSDQKTELVEMRGRGSDLNLDWISRTLYVVENGEPAGASSIMGYHMDQGSYMRVIDTSDNTIGSVISDPYASKLLWTEVDSFGRGTLMSAPMGTSERTSFLGNQLNGSAAQRNKRSRFPVCSCSSLMNVAPVIAMDYTKQGGNEVIFVDAGSNTIFAADINGCNCSAIFRPTGRDVQGLPPSLLAVDHLRVYWYNSSEGRLYSVHKATGGNLHRQDLADVKDIVAYGRHLQPLPDSECLDPGAYNGQVETSHLGNTSVHLRLQPVQRPPQCGPISTPQDKFTVYYRRADTHTTAQFLDCSSAPEECFRKEAYKTEVELQGLEPFTQYLYQVAVSNYYTEYLAEAMSTPARFITKPGVPEGVREVSVEPLTPEEMKVTWQPPHKMNGPLSGLTYRVLFSTLVNSVHFRRETDKLMLNRTRDGSIYTILRDLEPSHMYDVEVETCMMGREMCNRSVKVHGRTFDTPGVIVLINATHNTLVLRWQSPADNSILRHNCELAKVKEGEDQLTWMREEIPSITKNYTTYVETFRSLHPYTRYAVRVAASYRTPPYHTYIWPADPRTYVFQTQAWMPEQVSAPEIRHLKSGAYEVVWEEPADNGAPVLAYILHYSVVNDNQWLLAYNGSDLRWLVEETITHPGLQYVFRVAAYNPKGWGPFSVNSTTFLSPPAAADNLHDDFTIGIAVALCAILLIILVAIVFFCFWRRKQHEKKKKQQFLSMVRGPDTELATLRELPHSTFQQSNTLYGLTYVELPNSTLYQTNTCPPVSSIILTDEEVASLPHVCRDQLDLTQFLGSGAFGEVYEGVARDIRPDAAAIKCAVKTLRKSALEQEKEEFLKEAILMKNFQHEHILGLLGVCLDNDPHFIIMELMEGGDLLSFLRSSRASSTSPAKLQLPDLVKICVHVAKGCKYLEDMHFVHRDLAARNCLVSSPDVNSMVVKIGDFGLARDIYKHDYYRKEGEGLLPVRWMSPESLVDGVFTTQSDIWAFGVLMWEVVTLGQQPYPARTNIEVLHFVRAGGKLERPEKCTDDKFGLMQKCWSFTADERPCFAYLLQELINYEEKCAQMSPAEISLHSPTGADDMRLPSYAQPWDLNPPTLPPSLHPSPPRGLPPFPVVHPPRPPLPQSPTLSLPAQNSFNAPPSSHSVTHPALLPYSLPLPLFYARPNNNHPAFSAYSSPQGYYDNARSADYEDGFVPAGSDFVRVPVNADCDDGFGTASSDFVRVPVNADCDDGFASASSDFVWVPVDVHETWTSPSSLLDPSYNSTGARQGIFSLRNEPASPLSLDYSTSLPGSSVGYGRQYAGSSSSEEGSAYSSSGHSVTSATQVQVYTAPSPSSCRPQNRGGSVRMTPASKKKRLMTLLGGADTKEKLMVDLSGMGRSRTSSLDSKRSSVSDSSRTPYSLSQCPTVREYDAMGYLEPRQRRQPQYLQLINHAPELDLPAFKNARGEAVEASGGSSSQHSSAFRPVGPYSRGVLGATGSGGKSTPTMPPSVLYSAVTAPPRQPAFTLYGDGGHGRRSSTCQTYGMVSVQDPQCCDGGVAERLVVDLTDLSRIKAAQRKFSDQDLYSSPAQFIQRPPRLSSTSSSHSDHPYTRVMADCANNNNYSLAGSSARTTPIPNGRDRHPSGGLDLSYCSSRGKAPPPSRWTNRSGSESDSVFEQEEEIRYPPPPYINVQNGPRSRGQVYPENGGPLAGLDIAQASLV